MKLSVIIPCFNGAATIGDQLDALASQQWSEPWEIIFSDNGCTDHSLEVVHRYREKLPNLRVVDASARRGQPYALNVGAKAARGDALAFCDADDQVGDGWLAAMGEALAHHNFVAASFDFEKLNPPWVQRSRGNRQREGIQKYNYPDYLPHAGGGGLGIKRSLFETVGDFDETLPYLHDTDYCWRVQLAGTKLHFVPDAVIHIRLRHTISSAYRQSRNFAEYNVILYKRYRELGMPELPWTRGIKAWVHLMTDVAGIHGREDFARWMRRLGWRMGRLQGSLKYRVLSL